jgi:GTP-binding protein HflX
MRRLDLPNSQEVILSDTVGFISDLPTHLVAAFRATLEQVTEADVIVHVRDISRPDHERQAEDVIAILRDLGVEYDEDKRVLEVWNKIDRLDHDEQGEVSRKAKFRENVIPLSALSGEGIENFLHHIEGILSAHYEVIDLQIPVSDGKTLARLYQDAEVLEREDGTETIALKVRIDPVLKEKLL